MPKILPINVEDLLRAHGVESARLEFKAAWNRGPTALQVLQTICAFANDLQNLNGGYIILGVAEIEGVAVFPPEGLDAKEIEDAQKRIRGRCKTLDPPYQPVMSPEVVDRKLILVIWAPGSDTRPHHAPKALQGKAGREYYVRIGNETLPARGDILRQLLSLTAKVPFDDRRAADAPIEKLRIERVREFLRDIRSSLLEEQDALEIYRRMRISSRVNDHEVPRNVGLLFFSENPEEWFRGARIEIVRFAADSSGNVIKEKVFRGPVQHHLLGSIDYLRDFSAHYSEKLEDRPKAEGWVSFPLVAMREALVNAVYHRSYEGEPEPIKVYLYPDCIEVISYPGPVPGIELQHLQPGGSVPPVPARNRRIGELLKELGLAEERGTGIPKVYRVMEQNGSPPPSFDFDESRTYFRVTLPAHPEFVAIVGKGFRAWKFRSWPSARQQIAYRSFEHSGMADYADVRELYENAIKKIEETYDLNRENAKYSLLAEAREMLERILQMDVPRKNHAWAWFHLARVLRQQRSPETEIRYALNRARDLAYGDSRLIRNLERFSQPTLDHSLRRNSRK